MNLWTFKPSFLQHGIGALILAVGVFSSVLQALSACSVVYKELLRYTHRRGHHSIMLFLLHQCAEVPVSDVLMEVNEVEKGHSDRTRK